MPDRRPETARLTVVADLRMEIGDDRGRTSAHLWNDPDGLVLDVDRPAVALRAAPRLSLVRDLPLPPPAAGTLDGLTVRLRSGRHDLGRLRVSDTGRVRVRPSPTGVVVGAGALLGSRPARPLVWALPAVVVGLFSVIRARRRATRRE